MGTTRAHALFLDLEPGGSLPISRRIAGAVIKAIREGRLPAGRALPGTRALATGLGVHRNTIIAAFQLLEEEGWVETRAGSGTFVREAPPGPPPQAAPPRAAERPAAPFDLPSSAESLSEVLEARTNLRDLVPDGRLFPTQEWVRSYHHALQGSHRTGLGDKDPRGFLPLRRELCKLLAERRGIVCEPQQLVLLPGPLRGLDLVARLLLRPDDPVAVEEPGQPEAWAVLRGAGARLLPVPVDAEGLQVARLAELPERPRLVVVTPGAQQPTGVALSAARREALLQWSEAARVPVFEDDTWGLLDHGVPPLPALAAQDRGGGVLHVGSLGTALAPGMQMGYLLAHPDVVEHAIRRGRRMNLAVDPFVSLALAEWFEEGLFHRQLRKVKGIYQERLAAGRTWIQTQLGLSVDAPAGGLGLWLRPRRMAAGLHTAAAGRGILLPRPQRFWIGPMAQPALLLACGAQDSDSFRAALERLRDLLVQEA